MRYGVKYIGYSLCIALASLILLVTGLRLQLIQYLAAYTGFGFAHSTPHSQSMPVFDNNKRSSCQTAPINVLTFNVQYGSYIIEGVRKLLGSYAPGSYLPWSERYPEIKSRIIGYQADLIGLQEMHSDFDIANIASLENYSLLNYHLGKFEYGDAALLFNRHRFDLLDSGQVWLGPDEHLPLSLGFSPLAVVRYVNWALLHEKNTDFKFLFVNTHFDNNLINKEKSAQLFHEKIVKLATDYPIVVTGDFNSNALTDRYQNVIGTNNTAAHLTNVYDLAYSEHKKFNAQPNELIDHILVGGPCEIAAGYWQTDTRPMPTTGKSLSDHYPVLSQLHFNGYKDE